MPKRFCLTPVLVATFLLLPCSFAGVSAQQPVSVAAPNDAATEAFVSQLLAKMTLDEKVEQMEQAAGQPWMTPAAQAEKLARNGIGSFLFLPIRCGSTSCKRLR